MEGEMIQYIYTVVLSSISVLGICSSLTRKKRIPVAHNIMLLQTLALIAVWSRCTVADADNYKTYKHVAAFSIDGLHASDVQKYVALRPASVFATLLKTAYEYTDCLTSAPSDSFPGVAAFVSGASPRTTGKLHHHHHELHKKLIKCRHLV